MQTPQKTILKNPSSKELNKVGNAKNFSQLAKEIANWDLSNDLIIQHKAYKALKQTLSDNLTDTYAWERFLLMRYKSNTEYKKNDHTIVSDQDKLYQVIEDVTHSRGSGRLFGSFFLLARSSLSRKG